MALLLNLLINGKKIVNLNMSAAQGSRLLIQNVISYQILDRIDFYMFLKFEELHQDWHFF